MILPISRNRSDAEEKKKNVWVLMVKVLSWKLSGGNFEMIR